MNKDEFEDRIDQVEFASSTALRFGKARRKVGDAIKDAGDKLKRQQRATQGPSRPCCPAWGIQI